MDFHEFLWVISCANPQREPNLNHVTHTRQQSGSPWWLALVLALGVSTIASQQEGHGFNPQFQPGAVTALLTIHLAKKLGCGSELKSNVAWGNNRERNQTNGAAIGQRLVSLFRISLNRCCVLDNNEATRRIPHSGKDTSTEALLVGHILICLSLGPHPAMQSEAATCVCTCVGLWY